MFEILAGYLSHPFALYALVVCLLTALCSSLLGVSLVLKRFSFIGDGLSHVAFGAMAIAAVAGLTDNTAIVLPVTVISAVLLLRVGSSAKIKGDAAIAMISVAALAFGYLIMNLFPTSSNVYSDVCSSLFGSTSLFTLSSTDVWICAGISLAVILVFILLYNRVFCVTFDENFAVAAGLNARVYNLLIAVLTALVIVLAMKLVGSLIVSALVIFPALSAMRIFKSFKSVTVCSAVLSVISAFSGVIVSMCADTPVGATVVAADAAVFLLCCAVGAVKNRAGR